MQMFVFQAWNLSVQLSSVTVTQCNDQIILHYNMWLSFSIKPLNQGALVKTTAENPAVQTTPNPTIPPGASTDSETSAITTTTTTTTTTTSAAKPDAYFCRGKTNGLYPNPSDLNSFYNCFSNITYLQKCFTGLVYNDSCKCCDYYPWVLINTKGVLLKLSLVVSLWLLLAVFWLFF